VGVDTDETNLRCGICMPNPSIVALSFRDLSVHTDSGQEERRKARSNRLVILIILYILYGVGNVNIYTLWGRKHFFCLLHTFRRIYISFYSTSNGYNKEVRYSRVPRLSDIKYENCGRHRFGRLVGVRVGVTNFFSAFDRY